MLQKLKEYFISAKNRLFTLSSGKRIGKFALVLILLLDAQVLYFVIDGASKAGKFISYPTNPVGPACEILFYKYTTSTESEKISFISEISYIRDRVDGTENFLARPDYYLANQQSNPELQTAKACVSARDAAQSLMPSPSIRNRIEETAKNKSKIEALQGQIAELKASYDSALLEKIAKQSEKDSILPVGAQKAREKIQTKNSEILSYENSIQKINKELLVAPEVLQLIEISKNPVMKADLSLRRSQFEKDRRLYPVKRLGIGILFLLPLLLMALFWHLRARKKQSSVQVMASSHMVFISVVPILLKIAYFIYDLLPHTFFTQIFQMLSALNISFLWNYVVILATILVFGLVIWISQKFVFNSARRQRNRIKYKECVACEERLESFALKFCYFCGVGQLHSCPSCASLINLNFIHCPECGKIAL